MRDIIEIEKSEMPYNFDIVLGLDEYNLEFKYNEMSDLFTCTLSKDDEVLVYDEPLIYGTRLFCDVYNADTFPCLDIVPLDESSKENTVTFDNMGVTVLLTIDDEDESEE
jgi:hypothetical protein|nr:MAG TPA: hypothetical protein [Caudoviricetes sp.]